MRIVKRIHLPGLPDHVAQAVYAGRLMLGDHGAVWDVELSEWTDPEGWTP